MSNDKLIREMALGMGSMASGAGEFAEADDDMGPPAGPPADDMGPMDDEMGPEAPMDEGPQEATITREQFDAAFDKARDMAWEECCGEGADDLGDEDLGGMDDLGGEDLGGGDLDDEIGGVDEDFDDFGECMEGIKRIANMLTDDPDIMK